MWSLLRSFILINLSLVTISSLKTALRNVRALLNLSCLGQNHSFPYYNILSCDVFISQIWKFFTHLRKGVKNLHSSIDKSYLGID